MALQSSTTLRRSGQRDERRRRLLTDELANSGDWPSPGPCGPSDPEPRKSEHYGDAEFLQQQLRLLDLVPRRSISVALMLLAATGILAGLELAYSWMLDRVSGGGAPMAALDLAAKGSLGCWFCSLLLLLAAGAAILVYSVRRNRVDDYQGRYRIWRWAAACWFLMAADQAASLRDAFRDLMISLTGTPLTGDGSLWWAVLYAFTLAAVGSRLLLDMRSHRFSMGMLLVAALAQTAALVGQLGWILPEAAGRQVMFVAGAEMLAALMLLTAMLLHARHVLMDAEGLLPRSPSKADDKTAERKTDAEEVKTTASADNGATRIDPPHPLPQPAFQRTAVPTAASSAVSSVSTSSMADAPSVSNHKLSKAERRALKERLSRERLERQGRG